MKSNQFLLVLDRSGSMTRDIDEVIGGFNAYIKKTRDQLKKDREQGYVTTVIFDGEVDVLYENKPIGDVPELTKEVFYARGSTALNEAIVTSISRLDKYLAGRDDMVFVGVFTDGHENASADEYRDPSVVRELVDKRTRENNWTFTYFMAGLDQQTAVSTGTALGFNAVNTMNISKSKLMETMDTYSTAQTRARHTLGYSAVNTSLLEDDEKAELAADK